VTSRDRILARIRAATEAATEGGPDVASGYAALPRPYLSAHHDPAGHDIVALFAERAADYRAVVERAAAADVAQAVARALTQRAQDMDQVPPAPPREGFVVPEGFAGEWLKAWPESVDVVRDEPELPAAELDRLAGVVTGCAVAIAETGTIVLDHGPGQGRRALTLVPDFHLVIVRADQVAADLPAAFARLDPGRPQTLISGPSATSDIELTRVEGVHGPRNLHILLVT
jgi:L-lactate dehydrogenase complex protein LldG